MVNTVNNVRCLKTYIAGIELMCAADLAELHIGSRVAMRSTYKCCR